MSLNKKLLIPAFMTVSALASSVVQAASLAKKPADHLYFGVAYYHEYLPTDRLHQDIKMMKETGINVVRIAESTWATLEPKPGEYDFSQIDPVIKAMGAAGIDVIVGTPTYALPSWLVKAYPDILVQTPAGQMPYGPRQNMDITNPHFRQAAQAMIEKLIAHVAHYPNVIGYQVDNETKSYHTSGLNVQAAFRQYLEKKYPNVDAFNHEFGTDYWSHRIASWQDFPDSVNGSVNASIQTEFAQFQRKLVTDYLNWQMKLVRKYARPDQFVTQNFDMDWRGYSYGLQSQVNQFEAAKNLNVVGMDVYHPTQDHLTGLEIAMSGDMARSLKLGQNYYVIETQAQGFPNWTPYPGQLTLQAFSHLASGANMVSYWHWGTTANSIETYWRGLLSQDYKPNPTYREAQKIGAQFKALSSQLVDLKIDNQAAIYVSNQSLSAFNAFKFGWTSQIGYNDILHDFYQSLYDMNVSVDFVSPQSTQLQLDHYKLLVVPALYSASKTDLERLNQYVKQGGHIVYTFKDGFSDQHVKVWDSQQPGIINRSAGVHYQQFVIPENVSLKGNPYHVSKQQNQAKWWMELLVPDHGKVLAYYQHPVWGKYAAITRNSYGKGDATYIGFMPKQKLLQAILAQAVNNAGIDGRDQKFKFPLIVKTGINRQGHIIKYVFNYSSQSQSFKYNWASGQDIYHNRAVVHGQQVALPAWGLSIYEITK
ncbi:beta-galactosidase [Celerinatantimonas yamalensis]|uniref:Beta-galactosidase n=1 Tax=Celerinatantimonas yamalensis TaxID=559956 RepID=A0ABW9G471_9GAMM